MKLLHILNVAAVALMFYAVPGPSSPRPPTRPDNLCLALNIYHEARGETRRGQEMVGQVTLNRTQSGYRGASSVCETVFARKQFSWTHEGLPQPTGEELAASRSLARKLLAGRIPDRSSGALHYYNPKKVDAYWKNDFVEVSVVGNHRFMK